MKRFALVGGGIGLALGMPLFEVCLLVILAIDGQWFDASYTIRYFSQSANVIALLIALHIVTASVGALAGAILYQSRSRRRLRIIPGGVGRAK
jgi:ethanolamine transporter EutH